MEEGIISRQSEEKRSNQGVDKEGRRRITILTGLRLARARGGGGERTGREHPAVFHQKGSEGLNKKTTVRRG